MLLPHSSQFFRSLLLQELGFIPGVLQPPGHRPRPPARARRAVSQLRAIAEPTGISHHWQSTSPNPKPQSIINASRSCESIMKSGHRKLLGTSERLNPYRPKCSRWLRGRSVRRPWRREVPRRNSHQQTQRAIRRCSAYSTWSRSREVSLSIEDHGSLRRSRTPAAGLFGPACFNALASRTLSGEVRRKPALSIARRARALRSMGTFPSGHLDEQTAALAI